MSFTKAQADSLIAKITSVPRRTGEAAVEFLQEIITTLQKVDTLNEVTLKPEIKSQVAMERVEDCLHEYLKQNPPTEQTQPLLTVINLLFAIHTTDDINAIDHEGNTLLARALEIKNVPVLRLLTEVYRANANNAQDQYGNTLLHIKLQQHDYEAARLLVEICGATSVANDEGTIPLHLAAEQGNNDMVRLLLTRTQCDIDAHDTRHNDGNGQDTPLARASLNKHMHTVKLLVGHKAQINPDVHLDRTPLSLAAEAGDSGIVKFLLEQKAEISIQNAEYYTWRGAAENGHGEIVEFLMDNSQADMGKGKNAEACKHCLEQAADGGHIDLFARLEKRGIKVDDDDIDKLLGTLLCSLVTRGDLENIKIWLERITPAARPHTLIILLQQAAATGQMDILKYLIKERKADINTRTDRGDIPLHQAAANSHLNVIKYLVDEQKADINARNTYGGTLLDTAAGSGHPNVVTFCLERRLDVNASTEHGETPLQAATRKGNLDVVKLLVAQKANINVRNHVGNTLLHSAAVNGHLDVVAFFLEKGLDINAKNQAGKTPLVYTVEQIGSQKDEKFVELVRLLLEKGATTDIEGWPKILSTITNKKIRRKVAALIQDFSVNYKAAAKIHQAMSPILPLLLPSSADIPAVLHPIMGDYIGSGLSEKATWEADFINQEASATEQPPVTVVLVEQSLRTLAKEIDNPRLAATREERLGKIEAIRRQVIANVTEEKTKAKCIHYWKQLKKTFKAFRPLDPSQDPSQTAAKLLYDKDFNARLDAAFAAIPSPSNTKPRQSISIRTKPINLGKQEVQEQKREQKHASDSDMVDDEVADIKDTPSSSSSSSSSSNLPPAPLSVKHPLPKDNKEDLAGFSPWELDTAMAESLKENKHTTESARRITTREQERKKERERESEQPAKDKDIVMHVEPEQQGSAAAAAGLFSTRKREEEEEEESENQENSTHKRTKAAREHSNKLKKSEQSDDQTNSALRRAKAARERNERWQRRNNGYK